MEKSYWLCKKKKLPTFDSSCDVQEVAVVVLPQVSRVQPTVLVDGLGGFVRHVQVAHEDVAAPEANLPATVRVGLVQLRLATGHHLAAAAETQIDNEGKELSTMKRLPTRWVSVVRLTWWCGTARCRRRCAARSSRSCRRSPRWACWGSWSSRASLWWWAPRRWSRPCSGPSLARLAPS